MTSLDSLVILCFVGFMTCVAMVTLFNELDEIERKRAIEIKKKEKAMLAKLTALLNNLRNGKRNE